MTLVLGLGHQVPAEGGGASLVLRYLHGLSPEHQRVWQAKMLSGRYKLHRDYYRSSILGARGTRISIFEAFTLELSVINQMAQRIGRTALFRDTFATERRPRPRARPLP